MKTILSIGAHPDDIEIGCGGTEVLLKRKGFSLVHIVVTNGEEGNISVSPEKLARQRQSEARNSAKVVGADKVVFLGLPDGSPHFTKDHSVKMIKLLRHFRPEIIFTHSSSDYFPDHAMVHRLTLSAIEGAKGPWYPRAGKNPHVVDTVFGYEVWHPLNRHQVAIDITKAMKTKLSALAKHRSQIKKVDYLGAVKGLAQYRGAMAMCGTYAEVFEILKGKSIL